MIATLLFGPTHVMLQNKIKSKFFFVSIKNDHHHLANITWIKVLIFVYKIDILSYVSKV